MESLCNEMGRFMMDRDDLSDAEIRTRKASILNRIHGLQGENATKKDTLTEHDTESGMTPLMYACTLLETTWIEGLLQSASKNLKTTMVNAWNEDHQNVLMILVEAEHVHSEEEGHPFHTGRIQRLVQAGADPDRKHPGRPSAREYAMDLLERDVFTTLGKRKTRRKNRQSRRK